MFEKIYEIRYGDFKDFDTAKPTLILDIAQDIAIRHSDECGYGIHKLHDMKLGWMIQGINIKIEHPISTTNNIEVFTAVKNMKGVTSERGCIIKQDGKIVAKIVTNWFLFNFEVMKPVRITDEIASTYGTFDFGDDFFKYRKPEIREAQKLFEVTVRNKDIDTNKHLNNQKSAEMLMDALPFDFKFSNISILYKKAAYLGDVLSVCVCEIDNGYYVQLLTKDNELCVAGTFIN